MLIQNLNQFITKKITGVIHIGAHHGEEKKWYNDNKIEKVIWVEANEQYYNILKNNVGEDEIIISAIGDEESEMDFFISNNGQSSSFLDLNIHKKHHPDVFYVDSKKIKVRKMSNIIKEKKIDINNYNFINLDVQGYELNVLKGFDQFLKEFDYIYTEVNSNYLYKDCALIGDIDNYLKSFGFERVLTEMTSWEWGDAFYVKP